jgi:predicted P-loop ATPase
MKDHGREFGEDVTGAWKERRERRDDAQNGVGSQPQPQPGAKADYLDAKGKGACNVYNARLALNQEPELMHLFGFDEMSRTEMLMRPLFVEEPSFKPRPITDVDIVKVQSWLQSFRFRKLGEKPVRDAVMAYAHDHSYHPVRDYLDRCAKQWDSKKRVETWLYDYAGVEQNEYTKKVGTMFLIGMVARIYKPGCKNDYMPILEGPQGLLKSKMLEELVGEDYFSDQLPDINHKDASMHMRGKWLIEMAEMHNYTKAEIGAYKKFMTRRIERYRPTYGRKDVHEPRQCNFAGTTNKMVYLRDETGNRRSWPFAVGEIDIDAVIRDRDQLWGETVHLYRTGVLWWPDPVFERQHIKPQQEARFEPDPWEPLIKEYLDPLIDKALNASPGSDFPRTTLLKIAVNVLGVTTSNTQQQGEIRTPLIRLEPRVTQRISAVLHHLGWVPKHTKHDRWWEPGPDAAG